MSRRSATARACANVAVVKYWGKRDVALNLPATGSISLTLGEISDITGGLDPGDQLAGRYSSFNNGAHHRAPT